jgi:O-antigen/teichoic acid export membrane protein
MALASFLRGSAVYVAARILSATFPLLVLPVVARQLSVAEFGIVETIAIAASILTVFGSQPAIASFNFYFHKSDNVTQSKRSLMLWCLGPAAAVTAIGASIIVFGTDWVRFGAGRLLELAALLCLFIGLQYIGAITNVLRMQEKALKCAGYQVFSGLASAFLAAGWCVFASDHKLTAYIAGLTLGTAIAAVSGHLIVGGFGSGKVTAFRAADWRNIVAFGFPMIPAGLAEILISVADRFIVLQLSGQDGLGLYGMANRLAACVLIILQGVMFALLPFALKMLHEKPPEAVAKELGVIWRALSALFMLMVCSLAVVSTDVIRLFAGAPYVQAAPLTPWLAFGYVFYSFTYFTYLGTLKRERTSLFSVAVTIGVAVVMVTPLLFEYLVSDADPLVAAVGRCLGALTAMGLSLYFSQRVYPMPWPLVRLLAQWTLAIGFVALITSRSPHIDPYLLFVAVLVGMIMITFTREDVQNLRGLKSLIARLRARG